MVKISVVKSAF